MPASAFGGHRALLIGATVAVAAVLCAPARAQALLRPSEINDDEYSETWSFVADLDDGTYVLLQLAVTNIGPGSGTGLCRALVKRPRESAFSGSARVGRDERSYTSAPGREVLTVGACSATSEAAGTRVSMRLDGVAIELVFPRALAERQPPSSLLRVGERWHQTTILQLPSAVRVSLQGRLGSMALAGGGYCDHSRSNLTPRQLARRWIRFRALRGKQSVLLLAREPPAGGWSPAWLWRGGEDPKPIGGLELVRAAESGAWQATLGGQGELRSGPLLYRYDPVGELGFAGKLLSSLLSRPVTYTYRAEMVLPDSSTVQGIMEVSVSEG